MKEVPRYSCEKPRNPHIHYTFLHKCTARPSTKTEDTEDLEGPYLGSDRASAW